MAKRADNQMHLFLGDVPPNKLRKLNNVLHRNIHVNNIGVNVDNDADYYSTLISLSKFSKLDKDNMYGNNPFNTPRFETQLSKLENFELESITMGKDCRGSKLKWTKRSRICPTNTAYILTSIAIGYRVPNIRVCMASNQSEQMKCRCGIFRHQSLRDDNNSHGGINNNNSNNNSNSNSNNNNNNNNSNNSIKNNNKKDYEHNDEKAVEMIALNSTPEALAVAQKNVTLDSSQMPTSMLNAMVNDKLALRMFVRCTTVDSTAKLARSRKKKNASSTTKTKTTTANTKTKTKSKEITKKKQSMDIPVMHKCFSLFFSLIFYFFVLNFLFVTLLLLVVFCEGFFFLLFIGFF